MVQPDLDRESAQNQSTLPRYSQPGAKDYLSFVPLEDLLPQGFPAHCGTTVSEIGRRPGEPSEQICATIGSQLDRGRFAASEHPASAIVASARILKALLLID